ncbi:3'(2'),5'-bisphosphate nucleotidase CysQ family protein [Oligoflexus tunisiensis]|uniref:3'(2'),5'-bisphosphate nucleotidase CysQ family protein n=1 Tax=Oligoflexus tunisiensis TaxID=708132 RepID=UPI000A45A494|nr:3'(2'),5'-bisphosphate nucleotidase CysQ [Oligoflexus tunisiensis]
MIPITRLEDLALQAGEAVMKVYRSGQFDVKAKDDQSPVTRADLVSNEIICRGLRELAAWPIISEEGSGESWPDADSISTYWLIDPVDGTKEFIARRPTFTVNIALIDQGVPVTGVVYAPEREELYSGSSEGFRINQKRVQPVWGPDRVAVCSASRPEKEFEGFVHDNELNAVIKIGSSIKYCLVAKGEAHFYPRFSPLSAWDIGAGDAVARAAGCSMLEMSSGLPLRYEFKRRWNPAFILQAPGCVARLNQRQ